VEEGVGHGADDPEPECLPQVHGGGLGLHNRVELDAGEALGAALPGSYLVISHPTDDFNPTRVSR